MKTKVCIHMQEIMLRDVRGIPRATIDMTKCLLQQNNNDYWLSFFDYKKERHNIDYLHKYLGDYLKNACLAECNSISFKRILEGLSRDDDNYYNQFSYEELVGVNPDIIYFPYMANMPHNVSTKRIITTVHDIMPLKEELSSQFSEAEIQRTKNAMSFLENHPEILITVDSNHTKIDITNNFNISHERIVIVPMGYDETIIFPEHDNEVLDKYGIHGDYVLYLGALDARKGLDVIAEVAQHQLRDDLQIVVSGKKEKNLSEDICESLKSCKNVVLTGYVSEEEKRVLMSMAKIFIFPSYYEGFGLPIIEAMACGTPVITTDVSSLPEVGGEAACYIQPGDSEALGYEINRLLEDSVAREKMIQCGFERSKMYKWSAVSGKMERLFGKY